MTSTAGLEINQADLNKIVKKLQSLPRGIQRNASVSALNAGAKVINKRAKMRAPTCIRKTIKNVRLKQEDGDPVVAITAGFRGWEASFMRASNALFEERGPTGRRALCIAHWIELGTYGKRNLGMDPYAPSTLRKKSYASGVSNSPFWGFPTRWIAATPFLRPALVESAQDGSVERAMAMKFTEYFEKLGV